MKNRVQVEAIGERVRIANIYLFSEEAKAERHRDPTFGNWEVLTLEIYLPPRRRYQCLRGRGRKLHMSRLGLRR